MNINTDNFTKKEIELMSRIISSGVGKYLMRECDGDCRNCRDRKVCQTLESIAAQLEDLSH